MVIKVRGINSPDAQDAAALGLSGVAAPEQRGRASGRRANVAPAARPACSSSRRVRCGAMRRAVSGILKVILPLAETPASMLMLVQPRRRKSSSKPRLRHILLHLVSAARIRGVSATIATPSPGLHVWLRRGRLSLADAAAHAPEAPYRGQA